MKRLFLFLTVCVLLFCAGTTCYAGESILNDEKRRESFGIYATYVGSEQIDYTAPVRDGNSEIELPDKTVITVSGILENLLTLVVYPITEEDEEAWEWIRSCLEGKYRYFLPYEIYFLDENGNCFPADGVTISITLPDSMTNPSAYSLETTGNHEALDAQAQGGRLTFRANGSRYYLLVEKEAEVTPGTTVTPTQPADPGSTVTPTQPADPGSTVTPTQPADPGSTVSPTKPLTPESTGNQPNTDDHIWKSDAPRTGDESPYESWSILLCLSGGFSAYLLLYTRKKRNRELH